MRGKLERHPRAPQPNNHQVACDTCQMAGGKLRAVRAPKFAHAI